MQILPRVFGLSFVVFGTVAIAAAGCGDDSSGGGGAGGENAGGENTGGENTGGVGTTGPINAPADEWTWVPFADSQCMSGTPTGIAINPHATSKDVVIFLEGGNACFNFASCASTANPDGYDEAVFEEKGRDEIAAYPYLDRTNADNPFKDLSMVYVPYCSGDLHNGGRADVEVGNKVRQFHGAANMDAYLERIVETFPDAENVVLSGISAGGFGAFLNYDRVSSAFGDGVKVTLIDDCGPPMGGMFIPACLQARFKETWGFDTTFPTGCTDCSEDVFVEPYVLYLLENYPERSLALISSVADETISRFLGFGEDNCSSIDNAPLPYDPAKYEAGLHDLRDRMTADAGHFRVFLIPGTEHVFLDNPIGSVTIDGTNLEDWITQAMAEDADWPNVETP